MVKNEDIFSGVDRITARDGRTDGQTYCDGIVRAMHTRRRIKGSIEFLWWGFLYYRSIVATCIGLRRRLATIHERDQPIQPRHDTICRIMRHSL